MFLIAVLRSSRTGIWKRKKKKAVEAKDEIGDEVERSDLPNQSLWKSHPRTSRDHTPWRAGRSLLGPICGTNKKREKTYRLEVLPYTGNAPGRASLLKCPPKPRWYSTSSSDSSCR